MVGNDRRARSDGQPNTPPEVVDRYTTSGIVIDMTTTSDTSRTQYATDVFYHLDDSTAGSYRAVTTDAAAAVAFLEAEMAAEGVTGYDINFTAAVYR